MKLSTAEPTTCPMVNPFRGIFQVRLTGIVIVPSLMVKRLGFVAKSVEVISLLSCLACVAEMVEKSKLVTALLETVSSTLALTGIVISFVSDTSPEVIVAISTTLVFTDSPSRVTAPVDTSTIEDCDGSCNAQATVAPS
ncbi:hypothetical protein D3C71_1185910 [compost metagenome]